MTYQIEIPHLLHASRLAALASSTKATLPILECLRLSFTANELTITGTNIDRSITIAIPLMRKAKPLEVCVNAKRFTTLLGQFKDGTAALEFGERRMTVKVRDGQYRLATEDAAEFPTLPTIHGTKIELPANMLKAAIEATAFAASTDELRPAMQGLHVELGAVTKWVATDGHRMQFFQHVGQGSGTMTIPADACELLPKLFKDEDVTITHDASAIVFECGATRFTTRLIDEQYPNYESVIPTDNTNVLTLNRRAMIEALDRVGLFSNRLTRQIVFTLGGEVSVSAESVDEGAEARETLSVNYVGTPMTIGFNGSFVMDALRHATADELRIEFGTPTRAAVVYEANELRGLLMPVRLLA